MLRFTRLLLFGESYIKNDLRRVIVFLMEKMYRGMIFFLIRLLNTTDAFVQNLLVLSQRTRQFFPVYPALSPNIAAKSSYLLRIKTHNSGSSHWMRQ